jgi:hypothetical protein
VADDRGSLGYIIGVLEFLSGSQWISTSSLLRDENMAPKVTRRAQNPKLIGSSNLLRMSQGYGQSPKP